MSSANGQTPQAGASAGTTDSQGQAPQANNGGTSSAASQPQAGGDHTATPSATSSADYDRMIAELRKENAAHRTKLKAFEDAQAAADAAKLSDLEKASKRADSAEASIQTLRQRIAASELKVAAQAAGIIDHDVAAALLTGKVEYDAAGEPTNINELVTALKKEKPHLFGNAAGGRQQQQQQQPQASSGGAANPGRAAGNGGLTLAMIQAMPMRERMARMDEIKAWEKAQASTTTP